MVSITHTVLNHLMYVLGHCWFDINLVVECTNTKTRISLAMENLLLRLVGGASGGNAGMRIVGEALGFFGWKED